jgi:hypothetical protein
VVDGGRDRFLQARRFVIHIDRSQRVLCNLSSLKKVPILLWKQSFADESGHCSDKALLYAQHHEYSFHRSYDRTTTPDRKECAGSSHGT